MKIRTEFRYPPIADRSCDWCAYDDDRYDGISGPIAYGRTEKEAIENLRQQTEEGE